MAHNNIYTVNGRLASAENRCAQLEAEVKALRVHLAGELKTAVHDAKNSFRDGKDGVDGKDGRDGQSIVGPQGERGPAGDITVYGDSELREAVNALRLKLVKFQAALQFAYEQNYGTKSRGLQTAINAVLKKIEQDAQ